MSDLLPAVLLNALRQYKFDGSPLWRMADGKDHVKIEVSFRKTTYQRFDKKGAESRRRVASQTRTSQTSDNQTDASSKPTADNAGEGDNTASTADTTDRHSYHHSAKTTEDSTDHTFTYHPETSYTASFFRITTNKEAENKVAGDEHCTQQASVAQLDAPSDWRPGGRGFNPRSGRQHSFVEIDHEIFSTVILSLRLIQEGQLSVSGERVCTILVNRIED